MLKQKNQLTLLYSHTGAPECLYGWAALPDKIPGECPGVLEWVGGFAGKTEGALQSYIPTHVRVVLEAKQSDVSI